MPTVAQLVRAVAVRMSVASSNAARASRVPERDALILPTLHERARSVDGLPRALGRIERQGLQVFHMVVITSGCRDDRVQRPHHEPRVHCGFRPQTAIDSIV
jgi:hypothetical protein